MEADFRGTTCSTCYLNAYEGDDRCHLQRSVDDGQQKGGIRPRFLQRASVSFFTTIVTLLYMSCGFKVAWAECAFHTSCSCATLIAGSAGKDFMEFDMTSTTKCIMEDISKNVVVVGNYAGIYKSTRTPVYMTLKVQDPKGKVLYTKSGQEEAQFAFTASLAGDYRACFTVQDMETALATTIRLDWKTGVAATNWDDIAKKENLDLMATELRKLEQVVKEIHEEMLYFRSREEQMRNLNEATNDRVAFFAVCSLLVCVGLGAYQLWHLKSFFQRKKLL